MSEWQTIETAPRDCDILLTNGEEVYVGFWGWDEDDGPVFTYGGPGLRGMTHWMPLPELPEDTSK